MGAGPGVPGLLTIRARDRLRGADLVLAGRSVRELAEAEAEEARVVTVLDGDATPGAEEGETIQADQVPEALARGSERGESVVRLYPGDPFVLGAGRSDALALRELGAAFEVVPGVSTGLAAAVHAGVPLPGAGVGSGVSLRGGEAETGSGPASLGPPDDDGGGSGGMVVLAGDRTTLREGGARLLVEGWSPETPAVVVEHPSRPEQAVEGGSLAALSEGGLGPESDGRSVALVGGEVRLRDRLRWFEERPLHGRTVVVTRPREQSRAFTSALETLGARVVEFPTLRIEPPSDPGPLRRALSELERYDWVVFTSVNGVERVRDALEELGRDARAFDGVRLAAIGPATASSLGRLGLRADVVPEEYRAEALVEAIRRADSSLEERRILLARAAEARDVLPDRLAGSGAAVDEVAAYRAVPDAPDSGALRRRLAAGEIDWLTFTASSTVRHFVDAVGTELGGARVAAIGPVTAGTAAEHGMPADVVADRYTIPGLLDALVQAEGGAGKGP